jgi:hypothetical protein
MKRPPKPTALEFVDERQTRDSSKLKRRGNEKKEGQSLDTLFLLRMGKKYPWTELQRQHLELRQEEGPSRDCPTWGSIA